MSRMLQPPSRFINDTYAPIQQQYWHADESGQWHALATALSPAASKSPADPRKIRLISWNIDFMAAYANERMAAALSYLDQLTASTKPDTPIVVFLQEMTGPDLKQINEASWVKQRFNITDFSMGFGYGTMTLVDRRLQIQSVFRVPFYTQMNRDGLSVDIALDDNQGVAKVLRLCNVHLESLAAHPPVRPRQMIAAAGYLNDTEEVSCALLAGDLNAIQPFDRTLHVENDLKDTYLELGGQEDADDGITWGPQSRPWSRMKFGCKRLDKILFSGKLQPKSFERIGVGIKVGDDVLQVIRQEVEGGFVTDHYGVMGDFELTDDWKLTVWDANN